jgi:Carboxypeptidase regulatory-like domain
MSWEFTRFNQGPLGANKRSLPKPRSASLNGPGLRLGRGGPFAMYFLASVLCWLSVPGVAFGLPQNPLSSDTPESLSSIAGTVDVTSEQGRVSNLAHIIVTLSDPAAGTAVQSTFTDDTGHFQFTQLTPGTYTLAISAEGFKPWSKTVTLGQGQAVLQDATIEINTVNEQIEVQGKDLDISTGSAEISSTVSDRQLDTLPLAEQKFTEALPINPGVIRTREGKLNFNGQAENQGLLLVNSTETVDPVTGSFSISVPIDVIQRVSVHSSPDTAEYGGFSGGMTVIETKPPSGSWNYKLHNLTPSFRAKDGHLLGVGMFTPRIVFGGPLIHDKLTFSEELTYDVNNLEVRGLSWPVNETKTRSVTSFTQFRYLVSARDLVDLDLNIFPLRRRFANINALVPQSASSDYGQNGVSVGISDNYQFGSGALLNTVFRYTRFDSHAHGQGSEDMEVTPGGWGGNFFNSWDRNATQLEFRPALQFADMTWHGRHQLKIGVDVSRRSFAGSSISRPVQVLRQDGSVAEVIDFQGPGQLNAAVTEAGEFIEDHWILDPHLAIDAGARLSSQSIGRSAALGSHIGMEFSPKEDGRTVIRAGAGTVYGHASLLAASFLQNPTRAIRYFDSSGIPIGEPLTLQNIYAQSGGASGVEISSGIPRTSPRTFTWDVEVEREIHGNVSLKASYLDSQTRNLFVVDPTIDAASGNSVLALANTGAARYRQVSATMHARPFGRGDLNVSYIWSRSRGDLNTLSDAYMPFEQPVIRPNASGVLPSDVPNRVVAWGLFRLPLKVILSPVADVHTGLPYSNIDILQNYVGEPNGQRFPTYFSLDFRVYREFPLRLPFVEHSLNRKIRLGMYSLNVTNHQNAHDVYSNVASPQFGTFAGIQKRINGFVIDLVE